MRWLRRIAQRLRSDPGTVGNPTEDPESLSQDDASEEARPELLEVAHERVAVPQVKLRFRTLEPGPEGLGSRDGRAGLPRGVDGEVSPSLSLLEQTAKVNGAFLEEQLWTRRAEMLRDLKLADHAVDSARHAYYEAFAAHQEATGSHRLAPRFRELSDVGEDEAPVSRSEEDSADTWAGILGQWHPRPIWFWSATFVLMMAELPLAYGLSNALFADSDDLLNDIARIAFTVALCVMLLAAVKTAGVLFRRASSMRDWADAHPREDSATQRRLQRLAQVNQVLACGVTFVLFLVTVVLGNFRTEAIITVVGEVDASSAQILEELGTLQLRLLFMVILSASLVVGIVLAWMSTDTTNDSHRKRNDRRTDALLEARREVERAVAYRDQLKLLISQLGASDRNLRIIADAWGERVVTRYWTANLAARRDQLSNDFLSWQSKQHRLMDADVRDDSRHASGDSTAGGRRDYDPTVRPGVDG